MCQDRGIKVKVKVTGARKHVCVFRSRVDQPSIKRQHCFRYDEWQPRGWNFRKRGYLGRNDYTQAIDWEPTRVYRVSENKRLAIFARYTANTGDRTCFSFRLLSSMSNYLVSPADSNSNSISSSSSSVRREHLVVGCWRVASHWNLSTCQLSRFCSRLSFIIVSFHGRPQDFFQGWANS